MATHEYFYPDDREVTPEAEGNPHVNSGDLTIPEIQILMRGVKELERRGNSEGGLEQSAADVLHADPRFLQTEESKEYEPDPVARMLRLTPAGAALQFVLIAHNKHLPVSERQKVRINTGTTESDESLVKDSKIIDLKDKRKSIDVDIPTAS